MSDPVPGLHCRSPQEIVDPTPALPGRGGTKTSIKEVAREFEGLILQQLCQVLRKTVEPSGLLGDSGGARGTYEYLFDVAVVKQSMASGRSWGLAEKLERDWKAREARNQRVSDP